jgi:predicted MFS family arabinose efflux permease
MRLAAAQTRKTVFALGISQTIAWASTYYLPAILADAIAKDIGVTPVTVFTAFTLAMIISALLGPWGGRVIDRQGGRNLLVASKMIIIAGLLMLSQSNSIVMLFASWAVIGTGMGLGLYESAFATLTKIYGRSARQAITGITLIAGFASTVGWPLTSYMQAQFDWRTACIGWAILLLTISIPLNLILPEAEENEKSEHAEDVSLALQTDVKDVTRESNPSFVVLAMLSFVFAMTWFCSTSMATHLPRLLETTGASLTVAVAAGALIGPAQVLARLAEYRFMQAHHPLVSASMATLGHPLGALILLIFGGASSYVFAVFHGAGAGLMTIAKGTLPLALIGPKNYGYWQGIISLPGRVLQAFAPLLFGFAIELLGSKALWLSASLGLAALAALILLHLRVVRGRS